MDLGGRPADRDLVKFVKAEMEEFFRVDKMSSLYPLQWEQISKKVAAKLYENSALTGELKTINSMMKHVDVYETQKVDDEVVQEGGKRQKILNQELTTIWASKFMGQLAAALHDNRDIDMHAELKQILGFGTRARV
jgi:hypothetical protein